MNIKNNHAVENSAALSKKTRHPDSELCGCCCGYGYVGDYADESGDICECCDGAGREIKGD